MTAIKTAKHYLSVACPTCGAGEGSRCCSGSQQVSYWYHTARKRAAGVIAVNAHGGEILIAWLDAYFVSGNDVPVERAAIRAEVWAKCKEFLAEGRPLVHHEIEAAIGADKRALRDALISKGAAAATDTDTPLEHDEAPRNGPNEVSNLSAQPLPTHHTPK